MRVQACLRARDDGDSNFHPCGSPVRLVQPCLCAANPDKAVFTTEEVLRSTCRHVYVPGKIENAVSPLWKLCEASASLFMCCNDLITPRRRCCEARAGLFKCQGRSSRQSSPLWWSLEARASLFMCAKYLITPF